MCGGAPSAPTPPPVPKPQEKASYIDSSVSKEATRTAKYIGAKNMTKSEQNAESGLEGTKAYTKKNTLLGQTQEGKKTLLGE